MTRAKDLTGLQFGRWKVLRRIDNSASGFSRWLCLCDCGTERAVRGNRLVNGESVSCGCLKAETTSILKTADLELGKRYGSWLVIAFDGIVRNKAHWICRCRCGTERSVNGANIRSGRSKSCGQCDSQ